MDNLRWILILAGVAILVFLYFSGRARRDSGRSLGNHTRAPRADASGGLAPPAQRQQPDDVSEPLFGDPDPLFGDRPYGDRPVDLGSDGRFEPADPYDDDFARPGQPLTAPEAELHHPPHADHAPEAGAERSALASKFEEFAKRLSPKRWQRVAASEPDDVDADAPTEPNKIVTLHVVAPPEQYLDGGLLLQVFERRGYHFGELDIFHSLHEGQIVFSIAKMVKPGSFDINDLSSFDTPGVSLILQLPGPVPADVAFEVLVSEAFDIAAELGGTVLDEEHSTLSKQTVQHMRDGIYEYMHREKYFGSVPS